MADETNTPTPQPGRNAGNREGGGFRIRLSDNEMRAARSLQEAFRLRSTVAVLGFSLRTLAQLLEEGKLDELVAQQQAAQPSPRPRSRDGERGARGGDRGGRQERGPRVDPFARPARPAGASQPTEQPGPAAQPPAEPGPADESTTAAVISTAEDAAEPAEPTGGES
jgi:hypothetical protein